MGDPSDVVLDRLGNFYIADTDNHRIRRVARVILTAIPSSIVRGQQSSILEWASAIAVSAKIDPNIGTVTPATGGMHTVTPTSTTTYTLTITDDNNATATVIVTAAPTATLTASPATITAGQSSTLSVTSTNAVSAVIEPGVIHVPLDGSGAGSVTVSPPDTTTYTLTVTHAGGVTATDTAKVTVNNAPTGAVTISGTPTQGQTLTAVTSTIADPDGLGTFSYQWKRGGTDITGATGSTYVLTQDDVGAAITVTVSWTDDGGTDESLTSAPTAAVTDTNDAPTG